MGNSVEGIGFAIPINDAIVIASELIEHGYITGRPLIGITVETVTSGQADYYGWVVGAYIRSVAPETAADRIGLQVGDIIIALGDSEVKNSEELLFTLRRYKAGETTTITVWRGGQEIEMSITFDENLSAGQPQRQRP
jgi:serine protease Do